MQRMKDIKVITDRSAPKQYSTLWKTHPRNEKCTVRVMNDRSGYFSLPFPLCNFPYHCCIDQSCFTTRVCLLDNEWIVQLYILLHFPVLHKDIRRNKRPANQLFLKISELPSALHNVQWIYNTLIPVVV